MFKDFSNYEDDPIEGLFVRLAEDKSSEKIDLGIGVYRDKSGQVPVMQAVRKAEIAFVNKGMPKSYLSSLGNLDYCQDIEQLVFGAEHSIVASDRVISAQTPGAGSALRVGAEIASMGFESGLVSSTAVFYQAGYGDR